MNKTKGPKRSADESKETDGANSGFPHAEENEASASPHSAEYEGADRADVVGAAGEL